MSKIVWRANQVISIETKRKDEGREENIYALAQMVNKAQLLIFNLFTSDNIWNNVNISEVPILFCASVTRQFISRSNIIKQNIEPILDYQPPEYTIDIGAGNRRVTVWKGLPEEREVLIPGKGGGRLIKGYIGNCEVIIPEISPTDRDIIEKYELTGVQIYAEFNERLYLCYRYGKNVDPMKDLVFDRQIPLEYKEYIDIISS